MAEILDRDEVTKLLTLVEEAARSTEEGVKHFVEPAPGTLRRAASKRHHIVFGRRGSGKSSLLRKAASDLTIGRCPIAYVNLEAFKGHSYPDVLLSVLISTFEEFRRWMETAAVHPATRRSFWQRLFGSAPTRPPHNRREATALAALLETQRAALTAELHRTDNAEVTVKSEAELTAKDTLAATAKAGAPGVAAEVRVDAEVGQTLSQQSEESYRRSKIEFLHRHILQYQDIFRQMATLAGDDSYLFLDDLYHIRRADQGYGRGLLPSHREGSSPVAQDRHDPAPNAMVSAR
jgi:hypothetical protein